MPEADWLDRLYTDHPEVVTMARWLLELLDGRNLKTLPYREAYAAQVLVNTITALAEQYSAR